MLRDFRKDVSNFENRAEHKAKRIICELKHQRPNLEMVYLPNASPDTKVKNILVAMEPSFRSWAKSEADGEEKVRAGFRNFLLSVEDMILHFCAEKFLEGSYHITDISKIAIRTEGAKEIRKEAWLKQKNLLIEELKLFGSGNFRIIPVGRSVVGPWVEKVLKVHPALNNAHYCEPILHYSPRASRYRKAAAKGDSRGFERFTGNWDPDEFVKHAKKCRSKMKYVESTEKILRDMPSNDLACTYMNLAFTYKTAFEKIKR